MYFSTCTLHVLCYCVSDWHVLIHSDSMENLHGGKALRTTWHMTFPEEENGDLEANYSHYLKGSGVNEGHQLVVRAAKRVWEELYACKKPVRKGVVQDRQVLFKKILLNSYMLSALYIYIYIEILILFLNKCMLCIMMIMFLNRHWRRFSKLNWTTLTAVLPPYLHQIYSL